MADVKCQPARPQFRHLMADPKRRTLTPTRRFRFRIHMSYDVINKNHFRRFRWSSHESCAWSSKVDNLAAHLGIFLQAAQLNIAWTSKLWGANTNSTGLVKEQWPTMANMWHVWGFHDVLRFKVMGWFGNVMGRWNLWPNNDPKASFLRDYNWASRSWTYSKHVETNGDLSNM